MIWCTISKKYISFLKKYDSRIPNIDYGKNSYKPFFSPLFEKDGLVYVTQISSKKERHLKMKESIDFIKIFDKENKNLIAVINLNYMFPVPKSEIVEVKYKEIENFRSFKDFNEKSKYISLLKYQMKVIKNKNIDNQAVKLYQSVNNNSFLKKRCLPFLLLEEKGLEFLKELDNQNKREVTKLEESFKETVSKGIDRNNYNALTGNEILIKDFSSGDKRWIAASDVKSNNISIKENQIPTRTIALHKEEEKLYVKPIEYYNVSQLNITKKIEEKFVPMKEKTVEKEKDKEIGR